MVTVSRRSSKPRNRFTLAASRAPLGTPGVYPSHSRDAYHNVQPRIQILSRHAEASRFSTEEFPIISRQASPSTQSIADTQSNNSTTSGAITNDMAGYGSVNGDPSRIYPSSDAFAFQPSRAARAVENFESPPSSGPVSLEHYVKHKPFNSRKDRRGTKPPAPTQYHEEFNDAADRNPAQASQSNVELPRSNIQRILEEGLEEKPKVPMGVVMNRLSIDFPNFPVGVLGTIFDYPLDVHNSTGALRRARHSNGDISVFQWSGQTFCWMYLGRIPYARVDQFSTFLNNIYGDSQHFNMRGHKLARARISTMVHEFCDPNASMMVNDRAGSPVSRTIYNYQRQKEQSTVASSEELKAVFPTPPHSRFARQLEPHMDSQNVRVQPPTAPTYTSPQSNRHNTVMMFQDLNHTLNVSPQSIGHITAQDQGRILNISPQSRRHNTAIMIQDQDRTLSISPQSHRHNTAMMIQNQNGTLNISPQSHRHNTAMMIQNQGHTSNISPQSNRHNNSATFYSQDRTLDTGAISRRQEWAGNFTTEAHDEYRERERRRILGNAEMLPGHPSFNEKLGQLQSEYINMQRYLSVSPSRQVGGQDRHQFGNQDNHNTGFQEHHYRGDSMMPKDFNKPIPTQGRAHPATSYAQGPSEANEHSLADSFFSKRAAKPELEVKRNPGLESKPVDRPSLISAPQPLRRSTLTDEELRRAVPLVPQDSKGPFLTGKGLDSVTGVANDEAPKLQSKEQYEADLNAFWYSGLKSTQRQKDFIQHTLAVHGMTEEKNPDGVTAMRVMVPVVERLLEYAPRGRAGAGGFVIGQQPRNDDYFAKYTEPPEWCIDRRPEDVMPGQWFSGGRSSRRGGEFLSEGLGFGSSARNDGGGLGSGIGSSRSAGRVQSLLGEAEWLGAPERIGRDPRYRPFVNSTGGAGGFGSIGRGRVGW